MFIGHYELLITETGVKNYWSGFMNDDKYSMRGTIEAAARSEDDVCKPLRLVLADVEAVYDVNSGENILNGTFL